MRKALVDVTPNRSETDGLGVGRQVRNAFWLFVAEITGKAANLLLVVIVARGLGAAEYGYFNFALAFVPLFLIFANWGMDSALIREIARDRSRSSELLSSAFVVLGGLGLLGLAAALISASFLVPAGSFYIAVAIIAVALFVDEQSSLVGAVFKAHEQMHFHAFVVLANRILSVTLALVSVMLDRSLIPVAVAYLVGSLGALALAQILLRRHFDPLRLRAVRKDVVRELLRIGAPLGIAGFLSMAVYRVDTVLLQAIKGPVQVAAYGIAYRFFETFLFVSWILANVALPRMARLRRADSVRTFEATAGALLAFYLPLTVCAPFVAAYVVTALFSQRYEAAGAVIPVLVAAALFYGLAHLGRMGAIALGYRRRVLIVAAIVLGFNLATNAYAIPTYGYKGAAWTTLATEILEAILLVTLFLHRQGTPRAVRAVLIPALASTALGAALLATGFRDLNAIIVSLVLYPPVLVVAARVIAPAETRSVTSMLRQPRATVSSPTPDAP